MSVPGLFIEPARPDDAPACGAILSGWVEETAWMPRLHSRAEDRGFLQDLIARGWVHVARRHGRTVGFIARDGEEVHALYIAHFSRAKGIGRALLASAQAVEDRLALWCFQANAPARAFYQRLGFCEETRTEGEGNDEHLPDIRFVWRKA